MQQKGWQLYNTNNSSADASIKTVIYTEKTVANNKVNNSFISISESNHKIVNVVYLTANGNSGTIPQEFFTLSNQAYTVLTDKMPFGAKVIRYDQDNSPYTYICKTYNEFINLLTGTERISADQCCMFKNSSKRVFMEYSDTFSKFSMYLLNDENDEYYTAAGSTTIVTIQDPAMFTMSLNTVLFAQ